MTFGLQVGGPPPACRREPLGNLPGNRQRVAERERAVGFEQRQPQRPSLDPLHRDPGDPVGVSDVVNRDDGRMIEDRRRPGLQLETAAEVVIPEPLGRNHLQGDVAPQPRVAPPVDLSHPADPEEGHDFIRTEPVFGLKRHEGDVGMISRGPPRTPGFNPF